MRRKIRESVLKEALKLEAEQNLLAQDREPGFVQRRFDLRSNSSDMRQPTQS